MLTKYTWTVYCLGMLVDIVTDEELAEMLRAFRNIRIDLTRGVVEF